MDMYLFGDPEITDHRWYSGQFFIDFTVMLPLGAFGSLSDGLRILWMVKIIYRILKPLYILDSGYYSPILRNLQNQKT